MNEVKKQVKQSKTKAKDKCDNVIQFASNNKSNLLSENEINNLFLGFVNLIKRNAVWEKEKLYKKEINNYTKQIADVILELNKKDEEILQLKKQLSEFKGNQFLT